MYQRTSGDRCPYGHERNSTCPCAARDGEVPESQMGCRAVAFEENSAEVIVPSSPRPRILDRPEPGREAW